MPKADVIICNFKCRCCCLQPSNEAAVEFAVTDIICKSKLWTVSALNADLLNNVRVNQSEVALVSALLRRADESDSYKLSQVHCKSEKVYVSS